MESSILAFVSVALLLCILGTYAINIMRRSWDLLSWRNLFLLGFAHFYCLAGYFIGTRTNPIAPAHIASSTALMSLSGCMILFFILFMVTASFAKKANLLTKVLPKVAIPITTPAIFLSIGVLFTVALMAAAIPPSGYIGIIAAQTRALLATASVGLATYYLIARKGNPIGWMVFGVVLCVGVIIAIVGSSGRRPALGVFLSVPWFFYFTSWRYRSPAHNFAVVGAAFILGVLAIIVYSPLRGMEIGRRGEGATLDVRTRQIMDLIQNPKIDPTVIPYILYTDAVPNTLFIIDSYPNLFPYEPGQGIAFVLSNPIPRTFWPEKPIALGVTLQKQMNEEANLGPGIIGHGWSEGGWIGVMGYAIFFGLVCGLVDRCLSDQSRNPFFLCVFGSALGNVFGMSRGDTPLFFLETVAGAVAAFTILSLIRIAFGPILGAFSPCTVPVPESAFARPGEAEGGEEPEPDDRFDPYAAYEYSEHPDDAYAPAGAEEGREPRAS